MVCLRGQRLRLVCKESKRRVLEVVDTASLSSPTGVSTLKGKFNFYSTFNMASRFVHSTGLRLRLVCKEPRQRGLKVVDTASLSSPTGISILKGEFNFLFFWLPLFLQYGFKVIFRFTCRILNVTNEFSRWKDDIYGCKSKKKYVSRILTHILYYKKFTNEILIFEIEVKNHKYSLPADGRTDTKSYSATLLKKTIMEHFIFLLILRKKDTIRAITWKFKISRIYK